MKLQKQLLEAVEHKQLRLYRREFPQLMVYRKQRRLPGLHREQKNRRPL